MGQVRRIERYVHRRYEPMRSVLRYMIRQIGFRFLVKVERVEGLENFPTQGPAIAIYNHIAFVDPVVILGVLPRHAVPLAKKEVFDYPGIGIFPRLWNVINVNREGIDRLAIRRSIQVLQAGEVILLAPEGTRNPNMQRGKEGVAYLAVRTRAPVVPVAVSGSKGFPTMRLSRWKEPGVRIAIGRPFRLRTPEEGDRESLRRMTDEAMYRLAVLLPEPLRGVYSDLGSASTETLEFC
jgi:1-acyl-sn-glycerol-3-phosphate acyltransferase